MKSELRPAMLPPKPLMVWDGECRFCGLWIRRWQEITQDRVEYIPFQDDRLRDFFPGETLRQFNTAVHLIDTDGSVCSGAEAAFRGLAYNPEERWLLDWYQHSRGFARGTEWVYAFIARHRTFFSFLTRVGWGQHVEAPSYDLVRRIFLVVLALIYFVAFVSLWVQLPGLVGSNGIEPAKLVMASLEQQAGAAKLGLERYHIMPTLCWFSANDLSLNIQCGAGAGLALLVMLGIAPAPGLFLLWVLYLSLASVCREFLGYQWDNLLLEIGFLAIFFAPFQLVPRGTSTPSKLVLWLLRWLLFKLMFASGLVKLLSGDPTWRNLTALKFHYETQPLPTWFAWYAHQMPLGIQEVSTAFMFGIELVVPFLILGPPRLRQAAFAPLVALQLVILLTGNYCFFNLLTIALCLLLLDDAALRRMWRRGRPLPFGGADEKSQMTAPGDGNAPRCKWPALVTIPLACIAIMSSLMQFGGMLRRPLPWPSPMRAAYYWLGPFRTFNSYGLFAVMTTSRPEIIIEGSNDGVAWFEYEFKYKPGDLKRRPKFVEPHQPRLDWQMWFAALSDYRSAPWIINFCVRLLEGAPEVLGLLERNPFPQNPPRYIRAVLYEYHFTDFATRRRTGNWWARERKGAYLPVLSVSKGGQIQ